MLEIASIIINSPLFEGLKPEAVVKTLGAVGADLERYIKNDVIIREGEKAPCIGLVLSGKAVGVRYRADGVRAFITEFSSGELFGELISAARSVSPVTVEAETDCSVLMIPFEGLLHAEGEARRPAGIIIENAISATAERYFSLMKRIEILSCKSLRKKTAAWLLQQDDYFTCEMSRERLAEYLGSERASLSRELARMKYERLIDFERREFRILDRAALVAVHDA